MDCQSELMRLFKILCQRITGQYERLSARQNVIVEGNNLYYHDVIINVMTEVYRMVLCNFFRVC